MVLQVLHPLLILVVFVLPKSCATRHGQQHEHHTVVQPMTGSCTGSGGEVGGGEGGGCPTRDLTGQRLLCFDGPLEFRAVLGDQISAGNQAALLAISKAEELFLAKVDLVPPGQARVENFRSCAAFFPEEECNRTEKVRKAGVRAPACVASKCFLEDGSTAFVMQRVDGDILFRKQQMTEAEKKEADKKAADEAQKAADAAQKAGDAARDQSIGRPVRYWYFVPGETLAEAMSRARDDYPDPDSASPFEMDLPGKIYGQMFAMINAGYANTDQHYGNIMLDRAGQVWLIDFGIKKGFVWRDDELWARAVGYMAKQVMGAVFSLATLRGEMQTRVHIANVTKAIFETEISKMLNTPEASAICSVARRFLEEDDVEIDACSKSPNAGSE